MLIHLFQVPIQLKVYKRIEQEATIKIIQSYDRRPSTYLLDTETCVVESAMASTRASF